MMIGERKCYQELIAAEAVYHQKCSTLFRTRKDRSDKGETPSKVQNRGRQLNDQRKHAFKMVTKYIEQNGHLHISIQELTDKMKEHVDDASDVFVGKHMKMRLVDHFGDKIFIAELNGRKDIVSLSCSASKIIYDFHKEKQENDTEAEKSRIIQTAARLVQNDIESIEADTSKYPSSADLESVSKCVEYVPDSLMSFLNKLIDGKSLSKAALGQAIVQSVCSASVIAPMQIALAVQMHQNFGSRFLIDTLHELGFCSSYREVLRYERNAATAQNLEIPESSDERFVQFMADNVDHNSRKMDGLNTFHGMGIMAAVNPARKYHKIIPRKTVSTADIVAASRIGIHYKQPVVNHDLTFRQLPLQISDDCWSNIDIL